MSDPAEVLDYWIGELGEDGWFAGGEALDAEIRDQFLDLWQAADGGGLEHWVEGPAGALAYLVVCDQMPRNMHRGKAEAFSTDARALAAARKAINEGWDMGAPEPERMFFYLPFEHSEDPADQALSVGLMRERLPTDPEMALHAQAHQQIIARFGRFPFRNAALGRVSTAEEEAFMKQGGYGAAVEALKAGHGREA
jgi:uncharacterized protein (DUF924 family)